MPNALRRSTIYFEPDLHRALKLKAATTDRPISDLVNEAVRRSLAEDQEDLAAVADRRAERILTYGELLADLKAKDKL